jgi:lysyl-tRNA synthetase class 2
MLQRDAGKLRFIDIQDWTGSIQLFVGKQQVGDAGWDLSACFDLGDHIGVDGILKRQRARTRFVHANRLGVASKAAACGWNGTGL